MSERLEQLKSLLDEFGIEATFEAPVYREFEFEGGARRYLDYGYIDHSCELSPFIDKLFSGDKQRLLEFLFSPNSFVNTGNDSDETDISLNVTYPHVEYYKGN